MIQWLVPWPLLHQMLARCKNALHLHPFKGNTSLWWERSFLVKHCIANLAKEFMLFFCVQVLVVFMKTVLPLFASVKVLQHLRSVTILMALAILLVIAIIAVVAKIAYEDRSWVAIFFLVVTIVQVLK